MWPKISLNYSPNFSIPKRSRKNIKYIVIHYTGMNKELSAIKRLCNSKSKVSSHYFIKRNGYILNLVPDLYEAWHAGKSYWKNVNSLNRYSIGIEIQNSGHSNVYEKFSSKQIISLKKLIKFLMETYKVNYKNVLGHSDIAPDRKKDPGEKFPWKDFSKLKLSQWHGLDEKKLKTKRLLGVNFVEKDSFFKNLGKIGYFKVKKKDSNAKKKILIKAFQRRFRQSLINGVCDQECLLISQNLLKK